MFLPGHSYKRYTVCSCSQVECICDNNQNKRLGCCDVVKGEYLQCFRIASITSITCCMCSVFCYMRSIFCFLNNNYIFKTQSTSSKNIYFGYSTLQQLLCCVALVLVMVLHFLLRELPFWLPKSSSQYVLMLLSYLCCYNSISCCLNFISHS